MGGNEDFWFKFFMGEGEETRFGLKKNCRCVTFSGWWQPKYFSFSPPKIGEDFQFDEHIFQTGWNHQLTSFECLSWFECWDFFLRNRKHVDSCFPPKTHGYQKYAWYVRIAAGFVLSLSSWWDIIKALITRFASDTEFDISKDELECALMRRLDQKGQHLFFYQ